MAAAMTTVLFAGGQLAWLVGIVVVSGGVGVATWRAAVGRQLVDAGVALALGLAVCAQGALLCGLAGRLSLALPLAIAPGGVGLWLVATERTPVDWPAPAQWPWTCVIVGAAWLLSLYPPIGFDQTMYHLPFAELFARTDGVPVAPDLRYPVFAPLTELLQALVLPWGGALATQKIGIVALLATCLLTWNVAYRFVADRGVAAIAVATVGASPLMLHAASAGYVEPTLACWSAATMLLTLDAARTFTGRPVVPTRLNSQAWLVPDLARRLRRALHPALPSELESRQAPQRGAPAITLRTTNDERRTRSVKMALVAGGLAGSLVGAKYTGLVLLAVAWLPLVTARGNRDWRSARPLLVAWACGAVLLLAPSTLRLLWHTGNPVFPFAPALFGRSVWHNMEIEQPPLGMTTVLADTVLRRSRLGGLPHGAPLLVLTLPLALVAAWQRPREAGPLLAVLATWVIVVPPWAHYHVAILPHAALLTAVGLAACLPPRRWRQHVLACIAVIAAGVAPAYATHRWVTVGPPPATQSDRDDWSRRRMPVLGAVQFLNERDRGATIFGIGAERYVWFVQGRLLGDYNGPWRYDDQLPLARAAGVAAVLDRIGARYLLLRLPAEPWPALADGDRRLRRIYHDASATVYERLTVP